MAIDAIGSASAAAASTSTDSRTTLASNFDTFLTLLTTQLKNQNPLDPLDTNQFTQQLVQFAGVEQQLKTNDTLGAILTASNTSQADAAIGLVGKTITAKGDTSALKSGAATWSLNSAKDGAAATIEIRNANGTVVATKTTTLSYGDQPFAWDGKTTTGAQAADGLYSIAVTAKDVSGNAVAVTSEVSGVVDGVDFSNGVTALTIGKLQVPLGNVKTVKALSS